MSTSGLKPPPYRHRERLEAAQRALDETPEAQDKRLKRELTLMVSAAFGAFVAGLIVMAIRALPGFDVPSILPDWVMLILLVGSVVVLMGQPNRKRRLWLLGIVLLAVCLVSLVGFALDPFDMGLR
jgi:peptidoglycan/LPS O-acetylase OafA/YrhL